MKSCKEIAEVISESMDHKLPWYKLLWYKLHMRMCSCKVCGSFKSQMAAFQKAIECYRKALLSEKCNDDSKLSDEAKERIRQRIQAEK